MTEAMAAALKLVLRFHSGRPWTNDDRAKWRELTGSDEATTKVMCDHIRKVIPSEERGEVMTAKQLRYAAKNKLPVWMDSILYDPADEDFHGSGVLEPATGSYDYYTPDGGDIDLGLQEWPDEETMTFDWPEGEASFRCIVGINYEKEES
jgi:hypothetical protein